MTEAQMWFLAQLDMQRCLFHQQLLKEASSSSKVM